jgi:hypothetical protein
MSFVNRVQRALEAYRREPLDLKALSNRIDDMIAAPGQESKERDSRLEYRTNDTDKGYVYPVYNILREWARRTDKKSKWYKKEPPKEDIASRDEFLSDVWQEEPILAGAVYSMTAKMVSLKWSVTGTRKKAIDAAKLMARAAYGYGGYDWGGFMSATAQDFYTTNKGVFWELAKTGDPAFSRMTDIGHIDSLLCTLTGNSKHPVIYLGYWTGQKIRFQPGEFIHFNSMPSPRESRLGAGLCAVDRSLRAAKLLLGLHDYDDEKIDNLPPEGLAAISGLTMAEFQDAIKLWMSKREQDGSLTFPQVLWLLGADPNAKVGVDFTSFAQLPESFDRKTVVEQYVNTVALATGVDAREFWTFSGGIGGTAGESEIQHLKAKGKGPGEFISTVERSINGELPDDTDFAYDTQDIEEDASAAAVAKAWIDAYFPIYNLPTAEQLKEEAKAGPVQKAQGNPRPDKPNGQPSLPTPMLPNTDTGGQMSSQSGGQNKQAEQVIDKAQFMRLLADKGILPDWMMHDDRVLIEDTDVHNQSFKSEGHPDDITRITWSKGILKEERVPGIITINSPKPKDNVPFAGIDYAKEGTTDKTVVTHVVDGKVVDGVCIEDYLAFLKEKADDILQSARNIHGAPIPEGESTRGSKPTRNTIHDELEMWRAHPVLRDYAMTVEEENAKFGPLSR